MLPDVLLSVLIVSGGMYLFMGLIPLVRRKIARKNTTTSSNNVEP